MKRSRVPLLIVGMIFGHTSVADAVHPVVVGGVVLAAIPTVYAQVEDWANWWSSKKLTAEQITQVRQAIDYLERRGFETVSWTARVVQVKDEEVYVNAGANTNLTSGTRLAAYSKGEELKDPATGMSLGSRDTLIGTVTVTHVHDKFSVGTFDGKGPLKRGDILRFK